VAAESVPCQRPTGGGGRHTEGQGAGPVTNWQGVVNLAPTVLAGLAVTSHNSGTLSTVTMNTVSVT
jgi:hypothetical protein